MDDFSSGWSEILALSRETSLQLSAEVLITRDMEGDIFIEGGRGRIFWSGAEPKVLWKAESYTQMALPSITGV